MKILYDCFSCSPYYGSDEGIGWIWPYKMREKHEVWALVRRDRKPDIDRYCAEHGITDIHFIYCDIPDRLNFYYHNLKKGRNGLWDFLIYQFLWQYPAYWAARRVHNQVGFDLVHHVSTNDFRLIGRLHKLNIPMIIGPIGGAQEIPSGLQSYSVWNKKSELLRSMINRCFTSMPGYRNAIKRAYRVFFSNEETLRYTASEEYNKEKYEILSEVGVDELSLPEVRKRGDCKGVNFLWAGRMEYRKGLALLADVLKELPLDKKWTVTLCGDGSQRKELEMLIGREKYADRVFFKGKVSYEGMQAEYENADVFVFPSLRETTGTVLVEAMSHCIPVICLDQGGGKTLVNENCGYRIPVDSRATCVQAFAQAMLDYIVYPELAYEMGIQARKRVENEYTWKKKCDYMEQVYSRAVL